MSTLGISSFIRELLCLCEGGGLLVGCWPDFLDWFKGAQSFFRALGCSYIGSELHFVQITQNYAISANLVRKGSGTLSIAKCP